MQLTSRVAQGLLSGRLGKNSDSTKCKTRQVLFPAKGRMVLRLSPHLGSKFGSRRNVPFGALRNSARADKVWPQLR